MCSVTFEENVLLKLKRRYSESEAVALLTKELSAAKFQIGELISEREELLHKIRQLEQKLNDKQEQNKGKLPLALKLDAYAADLKMQIKRQSEQKNIAQKEVKRWKDNYFSLIAKTNETKL